MYGKRSNLLDQSVRQVNGTWLPDDFVEASLQADFHNYEMPLCGVEQIIAYCLFYNSVNVRCTCRLRAAPSPTRSPSRLAGLTAPCATCSKDLFALWANRAGDTRNRRPFGQESLYGHRPWQVAARGSVTLRRLAQIRGYCTPLRFARGHKDRATVLRCAAAIARTTCPLHSAPLRASPQIRAGRTPFHCAAN